MKYGRLREDNTLELAPKWVKVGRDIIINPKEGYKRIVDERPVCESGYTAVAKGWEEKDDCIERVYEITEVEKPPRRFSKLKIVIALTEAGLWGKVKEYIVNSGLEDLYLAATEFSEDDPYFIQGLTVLQEQLKISQGTVRKILFKGEISQ